MSILLSQHLPAFDHFSGMRTHIRMHFDKKTNDFNEENYISCTLDDEIADAPPAAPPLPVSSPENAPPAATTPILHCDKCSYTTSFKVNLVRYRTVFQIFEWTFLFT